MKASRSFYRLLLRLCPAGSARRSSATRWKRCSCSRCTRARARQGCACGRSAVADVIRHGIGARRDSWRQVPEDLGVRRVRERRMVDGYASIRSAARDSSDVAPTRHQPDHRPHAGTRDRRQHRGVLRGPHRADQAAAVSTQPDSLVMLWEKREAEGVMKNSVSAADYLDWARIATSFYGDGGVHRSDGRPHRRGRSGEADDGGGVAAVLRRVRRPAAAGPDVRGRRRHLRPPSRRDPRARRCGSSASAATPASSSRSIMLNGVPHQVVGVLPANAAFPLHARRRCSCRSCLQAPGAGVAHVAQLRRVCAAEARRVVRAGAIGDGSHRQGSREARIRN